MPLTLPAIESLEPRRLLATFTVSNVNDAGVGSLRAAILAANAAAGADTIGFTIPGSGEQTISPTTALPPVTGPTTVDGTTQSGFVGIPRIRLSGSSIASPTRIGLDLVADDCAVRGLAVLNFSSGLVVRGDRVDISQNHIGLDTDGTTLRGGSIGVFVDNAADCTIGGTGGNYVGFTGTTSAPGYGVILSGVTDAELLGNFIGTRRNTAVPSGSVGFGIYTQGVSTAAIGTVSRPNVVSGITGTGIYLGDGQIKVRGNMIGSDATGLVAVGNTSYGIAAVAGTHSVSDYNNILYNGAGIGVIGNATKVSIFNATILHNTGLGVDLGADGVTPNDPLDADAGPNGLLNFPTDLIARRLPDGTVRVQGTLSTAANRTAIVRFYRASTRHPLGYGQGEMIGAASIAVTTDSTGRQSFAANVFEQNVGAYISANTNLDDQTSEFASLAKVFRPGDMNGDGTVNNADIAPFVQALTNPTAYAAAFPQIPIGPNGAGDINDSGSFNNADIAPFVALLTAGRPVATGDPTDSPARAFSRAKVFASPGEDTDVLGRESTQRVVSPKPELSDSCCRCGYLP